ncbi:MAG: DnaJ domain-containing protein [Clostridia bacterium]|nr:DnaJ domain-containing protein [Clostridia bacterium]MBQ8289866.1 DnaJ domain-containing protein [Clostridia bacterium]
MNKDPYSILGVSRNASDDEIKNAYRQLVKKYHPDNYDGDNPLTDLAKEKMQEINWAYDEIQRIKEEGGYTGGGTYYQSSQGAYTGSSDPVYVEIRQDINAHRFADAERKLLAIDYAMRVAEWHYLMCLVLMSRKMNADAMRELEIACNMDPSNVEYQRAKEMFNQNAGAYGNTYYGSESSSYNRRRYNGRNDANDACDCCANLICLDCLCECMGGDFITCC